jgi:hypothetical protein
LTEAMPDNAGFPPTAADFRTMKDGPPSTLFRHFGSAQRLLQRRTSQQ